MAIRIENENKFDMNLSFSKRSADYKYLKQALVVKDLVR
jgi:hypothetical protein